MLNLTKVTKESNLNNILKTLKLKSSMKQDVFDETYKVFTDFKTRLDKIATRLKEEVSGYDDRLGIEYVERGDYEVEFKIAGDVLIFFMHTNVFKFGEDLAISKTEYAQEDEARRFCGTISVYNFLADSLKYSRMNDLGYMIARIFVNREQHYFVEGKGQLGFLYDQFETDKIDASAIDRIIESVMAYTLEFDLLTPPYDQVQEVSVHAVHEATKYLSIKTGKRVGYAFQADSDSIE